MATSAPAAELRAATALVFVTDLGSPLLSPDDAYHLGEVLRLKPGETVGAADGAGSWRLCAFTGGSTRVRTARGDRSNGGLEVTGPVQSIERRLPLIEVGFSWAKAERTEWAVAKLVELGVDVLTPLVADRTIVRPDRQAASRRGERLRRIVRESAMQSRRPFLPELCASCTVDEMVSSRTASAVALAEPGGAPVSLSVPGVLIGPEGGWSPRELALAENLVGLGDGVLRVETAAVTAGALLCAMRCMAVAPPR